MSDTGTPTQQPIVWGEHVKLILGLILGLMAIIGSIVGIANDLSSRATKATVTQLEKSLVGKLDDQERSIRKRGDAQLTRALQAHEAKNAHHGVSGMIVRYAPSQVQFVHLKARVEQIERRNAEWRRDVKDSLKEIKRAIKQMAERLPRSPRIHRRQSSQ